MLWFLLAGSAIAVPAICVAINSRVHRRKRLKIGISTVDRMSGIEFESFLKDHFEALGYHAATTPKTGDYGADLVLVRHRERIVLQAKRYAGKIGIAAIQQIVAAKSYYGAGKAIVVTNSYFTKNAAVLARKTGVELWDRNKLQKIMTRNRSRSGEKIRVGEKVGKCPQCGGNLVLRVEKHGAFYGCENYPRCRYTREI